MRMKLLIASVFAASMIGAPAAYAQAATGSGGSTTCSDFVAMDATAQADLLSQLGSGSSPSSGSGGMSAGSAVSGGASVGGASAGASSGASAGSSDNGDESGDLGSSHTAGGVDAAVGAGAGVGMDSTGLLAACQNSPDLTVGEAMSGGATAK